MPKSRKNRSKRQKKSDLPSWMLWVIGGIVALVMLFILARNISTAPPRAVIIPVLSSANPDLETRTRMLGDVELDRAPVAGMSEENRARFAEIDSLIELRDWPAALNLLPGMLNAVAPDRVTVVHDYLGFCYHQAARPDHALFEFREGMNLAGSDRPDLQYRLAFCAAYLFQGRGLADSALAFYNLARHYIPADSADPLLPALLNNYGLAQEATGDTVGALAHYLDAARLVDTTADTRDARVVRDNIRRLSR
jgi:tetratricopeptide (TPR) repeat protein